VGRLVVRRLAAAVALAAPVLGGLVALNLFLSEPTRLLAVVVSIAVGAVSVWYALTRRGAVRLLALIGAFFGVCSAVNYGLALLVVEVVPLVAFAVAGGYALGRDRGSVHVDKPSVRESGAARQGVLIVNPKSGGGKAVRYALAAEADRRGVRTVVLEPGDDLTDLAERAVRDGADVIGMAGGDGSQALVAAVAQRHGVAFVCVPSGTRNHFALDLGLDRDDVVAALDAFVDGFERTVDLGAVNGRVFVNNASLGVYARVIQSRGYRGAKLGTWARLLPDLIGPAAAPIDLEFDGPNGARFTGAVVVLVSNNPYQFARLDAMATRPRLDSGALGIRVAPLPGTRGFVDWTRDSFEVRSREPVPVGLDGETIVLDPPLRFEIRAAALRVRVPASAVRALRRPVNAALTMRDVTALARIVAGRGP
jgi:diacylglycerol kinase family enzyme